MSFEGGGDGEGEGEEEGEGEGEISPMCESIGHRPLRGRCPKGKINFRRRSQKAEGILRLLFQTK